MNRISIFSKMADIPVRYMPILISTLLIIIGLTLIPEQCRSDEKLTLASTNWRPYVGEKLDRNGFICEIVEAAWKASGIDISFDFLPMQRAINVTQKGTYVALFPYTAEEQNRDDFLLSAPFAGSAIVFYKLKSTPPVAYATLEDLKPYTIGVVRGFSYTPEFDQATDFKKDFATNEELNFMKLTKGRTDLVIADKYVAMDLFKQNLSEIADLIEQIDPPFAVRPMRLAFSKSFPDYKKFAAKFDSGLQIIKQDGTLDHILARYGYSTIASRSLSNEELADFVISASKYIEQVGMQKALVEFNKSEGLFSKGELYIFALKMDGLVLANINQDLVGQNMWDLQDTFGFYFIQEFTRVAKELGKGWGEYWWVNPITKRPQPKISYILRIDGEIYIGAGIYK